MPRSRSPPHRRRSRSRSPKRKSRSPARNRSPKRRSRSPAQDDEDDGVWLKVTGLPPKTNWSGIRRMLKDAGVPLTRSGKVYDRKKPAFAVMLLSDKEDVKKAIRDLDGKRVSGSTLTAEAISASERKALD
mmetsp:Transcript_144580/g.266667  ORF Transcript_144580/g.266667 Transcript_144580/m.266667 type:complete len:131 (-) Transcript_144580:75-467(-)